MYRRRTWWKRFLSVSAFCAHKVTQNSGCAYHLMAIPLVSICDGKEKAWRLRCNLVQIKSSSLCFCLLKVPILYNSLIISTYEIGKRKRVTIWLLLKFPGLPWFAVVSNNSCYWCKDKQNVLYDQRKTYFFLSGRLFCCHFDGLIVLLKSIP